MKKIILSCIGILFSLLIFVSCDESDDILDDKTQDSLVIVRLNDQAPEVKIFNINQEQSITIGDKIELKCNAKGNNQLDEIKWIIKYGNESEKTNYSFVKVGGVKLDAKSVDYSLEPLLLANPLVENMAIGSYSVYITVSDVEANVTEISYSLDLKGKLNSFKYDGEIFNIAEIKPQGKYIKRN